jgi:hypothetical protein
MARALQHCNIHRFQSPTQPWPGSFDCHVIATTCTVLLVTNDDIPWYLYVVSVMSIPPYPLLAFSFTYTLTLNDLLIKPQLKPASLALIFYTYNICTCIGISTGTGTCKGTGTGTGKQKGCAARAPHTHTYRSVPIYLNRYQETRWE